MNLIVAISLASIPVIGGGTFLGYKFGMKKMLNKIKSLKPKEYNIIQEENPSLNIKEESKEEKKTRKTRKPSTKQNKKTE